MKALLLAAGFGTRLRPITKTIPKCLVPIHGKPLLDYWLDLLFNNGIDSALINTHYLSEAVGKFVETSRWAHRIQLVHENYLLGTAGTLLKNRNYFGTESLMIAHADNLTRFRPYEFISAHLHRTIGTDITMMTFDTDAPQSCGIVELDNSGVVQQFHEKVKNPPGVRANAAVYIFEPSVIDYIRSLNREVCDISMDVLPEYIGRIQTFHNTDYHRDIGTLESLALAENEFEI